MSVGVVQRGVLYTKEVQEVGLFAVMTDSRLFAAFTGTPLYFIMLPMIGLLLTGLAIINAYQLVKASNRNFDKWFALIISGICAVLASVSLYGSTIATALGVTFAAGPWFFICSTLLAFIHQTVMLGINIRRALESPEGSIQRMHYLQAVVNNTLNMGLLLAVIGAITFVMLLPIAPAVGTAFSAVALAFTAGNIAWRLMPYNWKQAVKGFLHLGKPELVEQDKIEDHLAEENSAEVEMNAHHNRLFTCPDYGSKIAELPFAKGKEYLQKVIALKLKRFDDDKNDTSEKTINKIDALLKIQAAIKDSTPIAKEDLLRDYPMAFQSFWAEKGEVEQITDAAMGFINKSKEVAQSSDYSIGIYTN